MGYKKFGDADSYIQEDGSQKMVTFHSYVCDSEADVASLPDKDHTALGSIAVIMSTNVVYWLTKDGWVRGGGES